jgi:signal transduction histidine kinase
VRYEMGAMKRTIPAVTRATGHVRAGFDPDDHLPARERKVAELDESRRIIELRTLELPKLSADVLKVQDEERRRIARELHDDLGQQLSLLKMILSRSPNEEANEIASSALANVRNLSYLLHPPLLDETGLRAALDWFVEGVKKRSGVDIALMIRPLTFPRLSGEIETAIFRVVPIRLFA